MDTDHSPLVTNHSPGLSRAVHATASPRRGGAPAGYARAGALRERRRLSIGALAVALGLVALGVFYLWERSKATGVTYSHWGALGTAAGNDYDEGAYVISAQLLLKGYPLFHSVFSAQPALFLPSLATVIRLAGNPVVGGHLYEALYGIATLLGVFWMGWTAYRPLAAPLAVALLAVSPGFLLYAHAVEAEMPMLGLCTLAVAAAQAYYLARRRVMAALAGLFLFAGTEMKLLSVVVALPLALLLLGGAWRGYGHGRSRRAIAADALAFGLCLLVPAALVLLALSPGDQWRQVVTFHLAASRALPFDPHANVAALRTFLGYDPGLVLLAAVGATLGLVFGRRSYVTAVYALWFLSTLAVLWRYHPLLQHQFVPLLPPLALLGAGIAGPVAGSRYPVASRAGARRLFSPPGASIQGEGVPGRRAYWLLATGYGLLAAVYLVLLGTRTVPLDRHLFAPSVTPGRDRLIALLGRSTKPGAFVICDDPMVALGAHRLLAPGLEDPSMVRTVAGYLSVAQAEQATLRYHVAAIVASRPMFANLLPAYLTWAAQHYHQVASPVAGAQVYLRP